MSRTYVTALRIALVAVAVGLAIWFVNWRTIAVVPAGESPFGKTSSQEEVTYVITDAVELGSGLLHVTTTDGQEGTLKSIWVRPGMFQVLMMADWWWILIGLGLMGFVYPLQTTRWWLLMRCRQLQVSWLQTFRLVFIGAFSNFCLPGTEGGDIIKAWSVAKGTGRHVEAVMSVVFDRITGLVGLVVLAAVVGIFVAESPQSQLIGWWAGVAMVSIGCIAIALFVLTERGWLRMPEVVNRFGRGLPGRVAGAAKAYAGHPASVACGTGISIIVQTLLASAAGCCAWALGARHELIVILAAMPVIFLAGAIPLFIQGAGIMELLAISLLAIPDIATVNQAVAIMVLYRLLEFAWGLIGVPLLIGSGISLKQPPEGISDPI